MKIEKIIPLLILASTAFAEEKKASCKIESNGSQPYAGDCIFTTTKGMGGSFSLSLPEGNKIFGTILDLSVIVIDKGIAEVRGLTSDGINSRWGEAIRSNKDSACWDGKDFKICVYAKPK